MKILSVGDLVGKIGFEKIKQELPKIVKENNIDFIIVNGENVAEGMGITEKLYRAILLTGVNVITMGNHTWGKKEIFKCKNKKIAVINLIGRVSMSVLSDNPFLIARDIIDDIKNKVDIIVIDFHSEATAEKIALGYYLKGDATIIFGTHTHVQTADETILENGTAYITDIGMTGPKNSVIGMDIDASIKRFETSLPEKYKIATGECKFNGCIFEIDDETNRTIKITRINY